MCRSSCVRVVVALVGSLLLMLAAAPPAISGSAPANTHIQRGQAGRAAIELHDLPAPEGTPSGQALRGERAGPPYIGRGLMEAISNQDLDAADPTGLLSPEDQQALIEFLKEL